MELFSQSVEETREIGRAWAQNRKKGGYVTLRGGLGAGKTAFVQGAAAGLGVPESPSSPTFSLLHIYEGGKMPVYHFDLYRLSPGEAEGLGFYEYFLDDALLCLVEWPEENAPAPDAEITIEVTGENTRRITIQEGGRA